MNLEKQFKNFNERATKALGGTTKNLWSSKKDEDGSTASKEHPRDISNVAHTANEKPQVAIHLAPPTDAAKPRGTNVSRGEREERVSAERRSSQGENNAASRASRESVTSTKPELRSEPSETKPKRGSSGPADDMVMEQLSSMSQELANTKMGKQEVEMELKKLRGEFEKLTTERDSALAKAQQQAKELAAMKQAVVFESVEKGQLEVRKLRTDNVQLEARVTELTAANSRLEKSLAEKTADLQKSQEQEAKLTTAMVGFRELQQKEAKVSAELAAATDRLNNVTRNEDTKLAAQKEEHSRVLAERQETHAAEIKKLKDDMAKLEETSGAFRRKAEGLARDLKKRMEKDTKDDELKVENTRLKEEVQRKSKSLADAMQEILQGGGGGGGESHMMARQLQKDLEDARRQLGTLHEKEMTVEHLKSANVILSQRIMDLEAQLKSLGVAPAGSSKSLVTSSSTAVKSSDQRRSFVSSASKAKHSDEDEELP